MKTLKLLIVLLGLVICAPAFSFSLFDLPNDMIYNNPVDNLNVNHKSPLPLKNASAKDTKLQKQNFKDTIVINLAEIVVESSFPNSARECITQQVPYPAFAQKEALEGAVAVEFSFDEYGRTQITNSMSNDLRLERYVIKRIENIKLKNCIVDINKPYFMRFLFKLY